jgi:hypothetical protein
VRVVDFRRALFKRLRAIKFVVRTYYCLTERNWLMAESERSAIAGLIMLARPKAILEFGTGWGGATCQFDGYATSVVTVDNESRCPELLSALKHTRFLRMTTQEAAAMLRTEGRHFDVCLVDAGHTEDDVYHDVLDALTLSDLVLCHDSFNPQCRNGMHRAASDRDVYCDLDFVPGRLRSNGPWGGLALVIPGLTKDGESGPGRRDVPFLHLSALYQARDGITAARRRMFSARRLLSPSPLW